MYCRQDSLELIQRMDDIPTLPESFSRIKKSLDSNDSNAKDIADIIRTDQIISATILRCANSTHHAAAGNYARTLTQAITRLGFKETSHIVMASSLLYGFTLPFGMNYIRALWSHAFAVGLISERIAKVHDVNPEELFLAGLLHDIGRAIIGIRLDLGYFESNKATLCGEALIEAECSKYGLDHAEAGAKILHHWNLPESLQRTVAEHHDPESSFLPAQICAQADAEANERFPFGGSIDQICATLATDSPQETDRITMGC